MELEDFLGDGGEVGEDEILVAFADPWGVEEDGDAAGVVGGLGVLPFVADNEAAVEVEVVLEGGFANETGEGFAAGAAVHLVVGAHEEVVEGEFFAEDHVHEVEFSAGEVAAGEAGLVGDGEEEEAGGLELLEGFEGGGVDLKVFEGAGAALLAAFDPAGVEDSIPFEEYGGFHGIFLFSIGRANRADPQFAAVFGCFGAGRLSHS